ncbi:hypothetical protein OUZ56_015408 [Daphnia magna]|uniref:Uncharacterized protein n=1 Tax=Daphnia magna TaxID=35525 RepID=A0ABR0AMY6_9CRUS|nr:hypothetical protein OUZ56_015408 [Daphnia magna]
MTRTSREDSNAAHGSMLSGRVSDCKVQGDVFNTKCMYSYTAYYLESKPRPINQQASLLPLRHD